MSGIFRSRVLSIFKKIHRTRQCVFAGDVKALTESRKEINAHFRKNKDETDKDEIQQMLKLAYDVDTELRTNVIQAIKSKDDNVYKLRITEDTTRLDNMPFNENAIVPRPRRKAPKGCLSEDEEAEFADALAKSKKCAQQKH